MRIALIGIGKIANGKMQAINHTKGIKLVDAHDLEPVRAGELPGDVRFHGDLDQVQKKSPTDAFPIATPTAGRFAVVLKVIAAAGR
jgi:D-galactose 1-dehydrogenase